MARNLAGTHLALRILALPGLAALAALAMSIAPARAQAPQLLAPAVSAEAADFDVYFALRDRDAAEALIYSQVEEGSPQYHKWLTPQEFLQRFGPLPQTVDAVSAELTNLGMTADGQHGLQLQVHASAAAVEAAFGVHLWHGRFADGTEALVADRPLHLTPALAQAGAVIPQFTTVPPMHPYSRMGGPVEDNAASAVGPYFAADLRQAYDYPSVTAADGSGATIGILMENDFKPSDITAYFAAEKASSFAPMVSEVKINGGGPFNANGGSFEGTLDLQQSTGTSLNTNAILYNLHSLTNAEILAGLNRIVSDNKVDVVNMSFGEPEIETTHAFVHALDNAFMQGSAQGITFVASSGDNGAALSPKQRKTISANSPASDPFVTAVGGTNLVTAFTSGSPDSSYVSENAHSDPETAAGCSQDSFPKGCIWGSGGGKSIFFKRPSYQQLVPTGSNKARVVPDLAGHMGGCFPNDPQFVQPCGPDRSHDVEIIAGQKTQVIGTSASSPDFVGLVAIAVTRKKSRLGALNPFIYKRAKTQIEGGAASFHHKGIKGDNGIYKVKAPYDPVIGNGTVDARRLFELTGLPAAGAPGSAGNP
jgi:subtilase family serine protease